MTKLLLIGDLHLRAKKLKDISNAWSSAVNWAHNNHVDMVVQAGDVFDHANVYGREASTGTIYSSFLEPFIGRQKPIPLFLIPGNHDIGAPRDLDALSPIEALPWITVIRKPTVTTISDDLSICSIPWINRVHLISRLLSKGIKLDAATRQVNDVIAKLTVPLSVEVRKHQDAGKFVLLVGHVEITGAKLHSAAQQGGSFEFSPESLASIGADAYALAHIHIRQGIPGLINPNDGYLGCLCQLSFGEEGNAVGCRLLEFDKRKIVTDRWLDNKSSPRYFTGTTTEGMDFRPGVDYVKIRGINRPDNLPEGVIFERLADEAKVRTRTDQQLDCDMSMRTLLSTWKGVTGCETDLDELIVEADRLSSLCQIQSEAIGSLERINRIKIKNFTCHGQSDIPTNFTGICGIAGPNGSGKTTAIEAIMLALYGISPSRPTIHTMFPKGDSVESAVELEFVSAGKTYLARREFSKTRKTVAQKATLFEVGGSKPLASGADGVFSLASSLIGDSDLVLAGIFSSQGDSGNLVKLKPAARKDLFAKLLGTEKFLLISKAAEKLANADAAQIEAQKGRLETLKLELASEAVDKKQASGFEQQIKLAEEAIAASKTALEALRVELSKFSEQKKDIDRCEADIAELQKKRLRIVTEGRTLKQQRADIESLNVEEFEKQLSTARAAKEELDGINQQIAEATQKHTILAKEAAEHRAQAREKRNERSMAYGQFKLQFERRLHELKDEHVAAQAKIVDRINALRSEHASVLNSIKEASRRAALLKGFPDIKECQTCPLAKDSLASRTSIPELENQAQALSQRITKGEEVLNKHKEDSGNKVAEHHSTLTMEDDFTPELLKEAEDHEKLAEMLERQAQPVDPALITQRTGLMCKTVNIKVLEDKIAKAGSIKTEIAKIDALLSAARMNVEDIDEEIKKALRRLADAQMGFDTEAYKRLSDGSSSDIQAAIKRDEESLAGWRTDLGRAKARIEQHASRRKELATLDADIKQKEERAAVYAALTKAFGRDGIPQLIVDSAIPHLQEIMFDMMSEIEGKWTIRIATQHETQKGTIQERIEILVDDGDDERDISTYSGGEMNLLSTIVRIAFSILQAERSGKGLKVLVLDEAMYFADNEYSDAFMRMLRKLPRYFNQIFVISHSEFVLSSIPDKIFFSRSSTGRSVVQCDFPVHES